MKLFPKRVRLNQLLIAGISVAALGMVGYRSLAADSLSDVKDSAMKKVYEISGKDSVRVNFDKGSATLSDAAAAELKNTLAAVRDDAKVKEIMVIAYADQGYPRNQKDDLPKADRDLAAKRIDAIKDKLKDFGASDIKTYNMAEKSNWFEKTFVTSDAQVKREAAEKPKDTDRDDAFYQVLGRHLQKQGGAGTALIVMRRDYLYSH